MKRGYMKIAGIIFVAFLVFISFLSLSCRESGTKHAHDTTEVEKEVAYWTCGMHPSVKAHEPGKCPICNMDLVPVYKEAEGEITHAEHDGEKEILHWTCGMHPSVKTHEAGKCPICNMDLVPVYKEAEMEPDHDEHEGEREIQYWTCGMHPSVRADGPGKCPICNMDLVPVYKEADVRKDENVPTIKASRRAQDLAGIETSQVEYRHLNKEILTVGNITYDERRVARVTAWIPGRIDKLYVDFTGKEIRKGEPLALVYSPELVSTQEEYILALETLDKMKGRGLSQAVKNAESLVGSTKRRLLLWGVLGEEITRLEEEREAREHITITSPIGGTVVEKSALKGQYVKEGQVLYTIADLSNLWMFADIYEHEMGWIKLGQKMEITSPAYPGEVFDGEVMFIDPVLHEQTRSVKIRAHIPNPDRRLKPGMFVNVTFNIHLTEDLFPGMSAVFDEQGGILSIPASSVLQTGVRKVVYEEVRDGEYVGKQVRIGPKAGEFYPLLAGLDEGSRVVTKGNFLLDSQSQLTGLEAAVYDAALGEKKAMPVHQH